MESGSASRFNQIRQSPDNFLNFTSQLKQVSKLVRLGRQEEQFEFDWQFYVQHYEDLRHLSSYETAYEHWVLLGQLQGRFANAKAAQKHLQAPEKPSHRFEFDPYKSCSELNQTSTSKSTDLQLAFRPIGHSLLDSGQAIDSRSPFHSSHDIYSYSQNLSELNTIDRSLAVDIESIHILFDIPYYLECNPDVAEASQNPLLHFIRSGAAEGRDPHPLFDTSYYLEHNPDVAKAGQNPLLHFIRSGAAEGRDPHPLFDTSYYLEHNPDVAEAGQNPLLHFIRSGAAEGRDPHPLFDTSYYLEHNPDVAEAGQNPLLHFIRSGAAEGRDPHGLFCPLISIIAIVKDGTEQLLTQLLSSISSQIYSNWQLCIVANHLTNPAVKKFLELFSAVYGKVKVIYTDTNLHTSAAFQQGLSLADGFFIASLDLDVQLHETALLEAVLELNRVPNVDFIYSDHNCVDELGRVTGQSYKPDWSPDLLCSYNYIGSFSVIRTAILNEIFDLMSCEGEKHFYNLLLQLSETTNNISHIPKVLYNCPRLKLTSDIHSTKPAIDHSDIVQAHLDRVYGAGTAHVAQSSQYDAIYETRFSIKHQPLVSVIIPTKDNVELLKSCVESILQKTDYQNYEILILNNNSVEKKTFKWFAEMQTHKRIKFITANYKFNYSRLNNHGVREAQGDILIFLNNDTEVINTNWMTELVSDASREEIGVVGPLLLYADGSIQHAGIVVGLKGWADHVFKGSYPSRNMSAYVPPLVKRNVLAVTGACLAISRSTFERIGGFDEEATVCGTDVEIGIRAHNLGLRNLYNPGAKLYHHESKTRNPKEVPWEDFKFSQKKYKRFLEQGDPFYNLNLSLTSLTPIEDKSDLHEKRKRRFSKSRLTSDSASSLQVAETLPFNIYKSHIDKPRFNLLLPSINQKDFFGGIATAVHFFEALINTEAGCQYDYRIILTDSTVDSEALSRFSHYELVSLDRESEARFQLVEANDRRFQKLAVRKQDHFIATAWWTAHVAQAIISEQGQLFSTKHKLIYLIQDFEPGFYPWSNRYQLALNTYSSKIPTVAVFNTSILQTFFASQGFHFSHTFCFEPKINSALKQHLGQKLAKEKKILIYGRPSVARNAMSIILEALKLWSTAETASEEWEVISIGELHSEIAVSDTCVVRSLGKLSLSEYASLLDRSAIGISLMISPHPSYPPLEMAHFGLLTITNNYENKNLAALHDNITSISNLTAEELAQSISEAVLKFELNTNIGAVGKSRMPTFLNASEQFHFLSEMIEHL